MKQNLKQTARERFAAMTLFLLICLPFSLVQAQTVKVNGRVTDDLNEPMIGVSIVEKGTANGCITDIDGNYTLKDQGERTPILSNKAGKDEPDNVAVEYIQYNKDKTRYGFKERHYLLPIPAKEIRLNPNMEQNAGW